MLSFTSTRVPTAFVGLNKVQRKNVVVRATEPQRVRPQTDTDL